MSVKNVTALDLPLVEILNAGRTDASAGVLAQLRGAGLVTARGSLTDLGLARARKLKPIERELRSLAGRADGTTKLKAVAPNTLHG